VKTLLFLLIFMTAAIAEPAPIPRYASLRANAVNLHVGPGNNYPIDWRYIRQGMPIEIIAEFDTWRQIRDWQGTQGWVHKSLLSGRRTIWVLNTIKNLRKDPDIKAQVIARLEPGVIARALECKNSWCKVEVKSETGGRLRGWMKRASLWGVYPNETKF
jgi:SH3-like domain-containing protein